MQRGGGISQPLRTSFFPQTPGKESDRKEVGELGLRPLFLGDHQKALNIKSSLLGCKNETDVGLLGPREAILGLVLSDSASQLNLLPCLALPCPV